MAKWRAILLDFLERAGWSAGQVFYATLLGGGSAISVYNLPWKYALTLSLSAAVSSVILTAVQYLTRLTSLSFWPDLIIRMAKTFLGSLAASIVAARVFDMTTFHWTAALNLAALATIAALGKGLLARGSGAPQAAAGAEPAARTNPSTLPDQTYQRAVGR